MRNFPNFLDAYMQYANDNFCPPQFHLWTGLSAISAALERKVWVRPAQILEYPNIYVLLVSHPSIGKSTALNRGTELIEEIKAVHNPKFKIISTLSTDAALIKQMSIQNSFQIGTTTVQYSSGFFYASEASQSSLQNQHGNFNASITGLYDCPKVFRKSLAGDNFVTEIFNISFSMIAGTTFDFLRTLVDDNSVMGGLASRFIYVMSKERRIRSPKWNSEQKKDVKMRNLLVQDLFDIHNMLGCFEPTPEFISLWEEYQTMYSQYLIDQDSPRMESIMARKPTNLTKVCMLLSAAESSDKILHKGHWERGLQIIDDATKDNPFIVSSAVIANTDTQAGLSQLIIQTIGEKGKRVNMKIIKNAIRRQGNDVNRVELTMKFLAEAEKIRIHVTARDTYVELLDDPYAGL